MNRILFNHRKILKIFFVGKKLNGPRNICTLYKDAESAIKDIPNGSMVLVGGFGISAIPEKLLKAVNKTDKKDLTIVCNNPSTTDIGIGELIKKKQVKKVVASYVGENKEFEKQYFAGELECELFPQGTLAEKLRAGGAGIPAFYTHSGYKTWIHEGKLPKKYSKDGSVAEYTKEKEVGSFNGREYLLEESIIGDYALIKAWKADKFGNLIFKKAGMNFNIPMAKSAKITIVEVEEIVEPGDIPPDQVHLPGLYVNRLIKGENYEKSIERLAYRTKQDEKKIPEKAALSPREIIVQRAVLELKDGMFVNLGIGIPADVANSAPQGLKMLLQSENGILGVGPKPLKEEVDADLIDAQKETASIIKGASFFSSDESFALIRGGHLSLTMLGAMEVSQFGDLANWVIPRKLIKGMGGAMDLVSSTRTKVVVCTEHCSKDGKSKIVENCELPLTGYRVVSKIITDKAVFDVSPNEGLTLIEKISSITMEDLKKITACNFKISPNLTNMRNQYYGTL